MTDIEALAHPLRIDRNIKRLQRNIAEYNRQLADIENAGEPSKMVQQEYDMLYDCYIDDHKTLEALLKIKGVQ